VSPKQQENAERALATVLEAFETGDLPAAIAQTVIHRLESDAPSSSWSLCNQLIMYLHGTTDARGFKQWKSAGRSVKKGAKAFYILGPCKRTFEKENDAGELERVSVIRGFIGIPVFRLEDTEGEPLPPPADYTPATLPPLMEVSERLGVTVDYAPFTDRYYGAYVHNSKRIVLMTYEARTFFHELAHAAHATFEDLKGGQNPRQEIIAELTASTLCELYGFDASHEHSYRYIQSYAGDKSPAQAGARVLADVAKCLDIILSLSEESEGAAPATTAAPIAA
jgi:hypothetical protein